MVQEQKFFKELIIQIRPKKKKKKKKKEEW